MTSPAVFRRSLWQVMQYFVKTWACCCWGNDHRGTRSTETQTCKAAFVTFVTMGFMGGL